MANNVLNTVQDTLFAPNGQLVSGQVSITNAQSMMDANGNEIPQGTTVLVNVENGALSVELTPNVGSTPANTFYTVKYKVTESWFTEYWVVPGSPPPCNLQDVRTLVPPTPTPMFSVQQVIPPSGAVPGEFLEWTGEGWETSSASAALKVNSTTVESPNLDNSTPAAPSGKTNVTWQTDGANISAYVPSASAPGGPDGSVQFNNDNVLDGLASFYINPANGEVTIIDTDTIGTNLAALSVKGDVNQNNDIQDWYLGTSTIGDGADIWLDSGGGLNWGADANLVAGGGFAASGAKAAIAGTTCSLSLDLSGVANVLKLTNGGNVNIESDGSSNLTVEGTSVSITTGSSGGQIQFQSLQSAIFQCAAAFAANVTLESTLTDGSSSVGTLGQLLSSTGSGTQWVDAPSSPVSSVFGRTGAVVAVSTDYSGYYDSLGAASTAQSNAESYALGLVNALSSVYLALTGGTLSGNLLFSADNTHTIGASGATRPSTIYAGTSVLAPLFNAATGFQIAGAAASGHYLRGNGTDYVDNTIQAADVPTLNQNTTGTAGGLSGSPSVSVTNLTVTGTTSFASASIAIAALTHDTIGLTDSTGLFTVSGSPATLGGSITLSAFASQSQNAFLAGPASGGSGASSFRAMQTADLPTSGTWAFAGTLSGNFTLTGNTLQTGTDTLGLASYTAGVSNSPSMVIAGSYESSLTGPTYAEDSWTLQNVVGSGVNGTSSLTITHSGSTGTARIVAPANAGVYGWAGGTGGVGPSTAGANLVGLFASGIEQVRVTGSGVGIGGSISVGVATTSLDTSINRLAATSLAIGTTISGDWSGGMKASGHTGSSLSLAPLSNVGTVTVTPTGGSASTWTYVVVAKDFNGNVCAASSPASTTTGAATLSAGAFNTLTWTAIPGASSYDVYRTTHATSPTTLGKIGNVLSSVAVASTGFKDTGLAGDSTTAPSINLTGTIQLAAAAAAPASATTPGTAGQIIYYGGNFYYCTVTGAAGSATWNTANLTSV
jgi:hypothetical protein